MRCKNTLCIYQKEEACVIPDEISIDDWGRCETYLQVWLEDDLLIQEKKRLLSDYESPEFAEKIYPF